VDRDGGRVGGGGARYLLRLFREAGESWINHREPAEKGKALHAHAMIHKPWTGMAGVRQRVIGHPEEGTYGGVFREATGLLSPSEGPD
jgi:hypothetical protein